MNIKCFVVHYPKLHKRKALLNKLLEINHMTAQYVDHYDRNTLTIEDKKYFDANRVDNTNMAISLSHFYCYKEILKNYNYALILEDDAIFNNVFSRAIRFYMQHLPSDWDMLFLGDGCGMHIPKNILQKNKNCHIFRSNSTRCTDSYLVSKKCAEKIIAEIESDGFVCNMPIDHWLNVVINKYDLKVFWAEPTIVTQGSQKNLYNSSNGN